MDKATPPPSSPVIVSSPHDSTGTGPTEYSPVLERALGAPGKQLVRENDGSPKSAAMPKSVWVPPTIASSSIEAPTPSSSNQAASTASSSTPSIVVTPPDSKSALEASAGQAPCFTTHMRRDFGEYVTRHLMIDAERNPVGMDFVIKQIQLTGVLGIQGTDYHLTRRDHVYLFEFDDLAVSVRLRDYVVTILAHLVLSARDVGIKFDFLTPEDASSARGILDPNSKVALKPVDAWEGQVYVQVSVEYGIEAKNSGYKGSQSHDQIVHAMIQNSLGSYGAVYHVHSDWRKNHATRLTYQVEFESIIASQNLCIAWKTYDYAGLDRPVQINDLQFPASWRIVNIQAVSQLEGGDEPPFPRASLSDGLRGSPLRGESLHSEPLRGEPLRGEPLRGEPYRGPHSKGPGGLGYGPGGFGSRSYGHDAFGPWAASMSMNPWVAGEPLFPYYPNDNLYGFRGNSNHRRGHRGGRSWNERDNTVLAVNILDGSDVRTTIMLRNIPNRMTDAQLLYLVYRLGFLGLIDFMYLRMDFRSGANVGYAFFNFTSPIHILGFLDCFEGKPWPIFSTGKLAEISYATSQGLEALIQKFRNSSVMRELKSCRPKLFYTVSDNVPVELYGKEKPFPEPDNEQKLERSIQNAQNIGLFPPNGRNGSPNHRDRHSMFDRGTPRDLASSGSLALTQTHGYGPISPLKYHHGTPRLGY